MKLFSNAVIHTNELMINGISQNKYHIYKRYFFTVMAGCMCWFFAAAQSGDQLVDGFRNPPNSAKPWTYWFWINGNITRESIKADLEAMARVGIHGVLIMEVAKPNQPNTF